MEHYYVVTGNEYGVDIDTKKNFVTQESAEEHFDLVKDDDFACLLYHVDMNGKEKRIKIKIEE